MNATLFLIPFSFFSSHTRSFTLLHSIRNELIVETFSILVDGDVESFVDDLEVVSGNRADHLPDFDAFFIVGLQAYHCLLRKLLELRVRVESMSGLFVVGIKVLDIRLVCFVVGEGLLHVCNQHSELSTPVTHMIGPQNFVSHVF